MSATEATEQRSLSAQAVDEEFEKLQRFHVDHRRIVLFGDKDSPEGGFGVVQRGELYESTYLPTWLATRRYGPPQSVAVKQIKITRMSNAPRVKRAFTREMLVWSSLEAHPGIAKFIGFYADFKRSEAWLLSPWEPNGNVGEFVRAHKLEVPEKLSLVYDTIDALAFLHGLEPPVCHGDIKSANVLVGADYKARLCDFGLARLHEDSGFGRLETSTGNKASIRWCSPELIDGAPRAPTSDVYAWAWLVWEIMTGNLPYEGTTADYAIIRQIFESPLPQPRCTPAPANAGHQTRSAALLENLGDLESWKGNHETSSAYLDDALRLYQEQACNKGIASVLRKQAAAAYSRSDYGEGITKATTALEHFRNLNDPLGIADASLQLGSSLFMLNQRPEALPVLQQALELYRAQGNDVGATLCLERIAELKRWDYGLQSEALSALEEAVAVASRSGDRLGMAKALNTIGVVHIDQWDSDKAAEAFSKARPIAQSIGWYAGLAAIGRRMGSIKMRAGDYHEAEALYQDSISIARQHRERWDLACGLEYLGECLERQSKYDEAVSALAEASQLFQELSRPEDSVQLSSSLVRLTSSQGDWNGALFWHDRIIAVYRSQKEYVRVADQLAQKGGTLVAAQRYDEAALHLEAAIAMYGENEYSWIWRLEQLCAIPKTAMKWERRSPLLCNLKKLQRRQPQLTTATLKLRIPFNSGEP